MNADLGKQAGVILRKLLYENYKNQTDFAFDYGIAEKTVGRYLNGGIDSVATIDSLANFFGITFYEFIGMMESEGKASE